MKKGLILIIFAWTVEAVGVIAGFITAMVTTFPDGLLPEEMWKWLWVLPMGMIAVAELGRIPLTSLLFHRHRVMQVVAFAGIVFLAGLAFENWLFGFERIVALRLKSVTEASLVLSKARAELESLEKDRAAVAGGNSERRDELRGDLDGVREQLQVKEDNHLKKLEEIRKTCKMVKESCANPQQDAENRTHAREIKPLQEREADLEKQINILVTSDRGDTRKLDAEIAVARVTVKKAESVRKEELNSNQIFRLAAMWYRTGVEDVTDAQFEFVRFWFSVFSAIAVAMAGTVAALVYYAKDRVPGKPTAFGKLVMTARAYIARRRKKIVVEKIIYKDGKEIIERIVLIPRWGIKFPVHVNSLIKDEKPKVTMMKKAT